MRALAALLLAFALSVTAAPVAQNLTRYVTDQGEFPLRAGPAASEPVTRMVPGGMMVTVQETLPEAGYARVLTGDNSVGWIETRLLVEQPGSRARLAAAVKERDRLAVENKELRDKLTQAEAAIAALGGTDAAKAALTIQKLQLELAEVRRVSASALAIDEERKRLTEANLALERERQKLEVEIGRLHDRTARDWFMIGGGVLLLGVVTGALLGRMRGRRRAGWDQL